MSRRRSAASCLDRPSTGTPGTTCASARPGFAKRIRGFKSIGDFPDFTYFGGNSELRGYDYLQHRDRTWCSPTRNCASRSSKPALTPIGVVGGIRGVFFANIGGGWFDGQLSGTAANGCGDPTATFKFFSNNTMVCTPVIGNVTDAAGNIVPNPLDPSVPLIKYGAPRRVTGFRLQDGRASYGIGLETFALGFPIHFDWAWRTLFNTAWEDTVFAGVGGSYAFRKPRFAVWIGYDF